MSPHAMTSLVSDLVEMAKAVELLPQVQAELDRARETIDHRGQHIEQLELKAHAYKQEIETLHSTIRELEVAKDQAETMFLEADERTTRALDFIKSSFCAAGSLIQALKPAKVEPIVEPINPHANEPLPVSPALQETVTHEAEPIPVEKSPYYPETDHGEPVQDFNAEPPSGPYSGKRYIDVLGFLSRDEWLAGGGTEYDYDWRYGQDYLPF
jgi:hypothetical protein